MDYTDTSIGIIKNVAFLSSALLSMRDADDDAVKAFLTDKFDEQVRKALYEIEEFHTITSLNYNEVKDARKPKEKSNNDIGSCSFLITYDRHGRACPHFGNHDGSVA